MDLKKLEKYTFKNIPLNSLADYKGQTKEKKQPKSKKLGETDLVNDIRNDISTLSEETPFRWQEDVGNYPHVKLITTVENLHALLSLSHSAMKLLLWTLFQLQYRLEVVDLNPTTLKRRGCKLAPASRVEAIKELELGRFIKRIGTGQKDDDYWHFFINPQIMWRGDAKKYYEDVLNHKPEYKDKSVHVGPKQSYKRKPKSDT